MTGFPDYGAMRFVLMEMSANLHPKAPTAPPTAWERLRARVRSLF